MRKEERPCLMKDNSLVESKSVSLWAPIDIPVEEQWLFDNEAALKQVKQGLEDSAAGRVQKRVI